MAVLIALLSYVAVDIQIWQRIFETNEAWSFAQQYHYGWKIMLYGLLLMGAFLLLPDLKAVLVYTVSLWVLTHNGTEDVLYYWLDGRALLEGAGVDTFHWLEDSTYIWFHPVTPENLLSNVFTQGLLLICYWIIIFNIKDNK